MLAFIRYVELFVAITIPYIESILFSTTNYAQMSVKSVNLGITQIIMKL